MRTQRNIYKRKDGRWEGRYFKEYDKNGKIKYGSVYAKTYVDVKSKLNNIKDNLIKSTVKTINTDFKIICYEWLEFKKDKVKLSSFSKYKFVSEKYILPYFHNFKMYNINKNSLYSLMEKNKALSQRTLNHIAVVFKSIIKFAKEKYDFNVEIKNYCFANSKDGKIKVLSATEQKKLENYLLSNLDSSKLGVLLCLYTGIRIGELCALKWSQIDLQNGILRINNTLQRIQNTDKESKNRTILLIEKPKSDNSIREVPLQSSVMFLLEKHKPLHCKNSYFLTGNSNFVEPRTMQNRFKKYLNRAELQNINFHALRHTFATRAIESGINVKTVSEILGHSSVNLTLQKYVHISMEQKKREINKLNF